MDAVGASASTIAPRPYSKPSSFPNFKREKTYAQKIRDEFYEKERKRLPEILKEVEQILENPEKDPYGEFRGLRTYHEESLHRGASIKSAKKKLSAMIGKRHALRHGYHKLRHMLKGNQLAKSILGRDTDQSINVPQARIILNQFWCYGRSKVYEHLMREEEIRRQTKLFLHQALEGPRIRRIDCTNQQLHSFAQELKQKLPELMESGDNTNTSESSST